MKLVYIATHPITAYRLMDGQLRYMRERGFDVAVITAPGPLLDQTAEREGVAALGIPMQREPAPLADLVALARLIVALRRMKPDIVNAGTPKGGLLGVIAARAAGVPSVVYLLRGLRFEGARGAKRLILAATEHVAGALSHRVFVNSESLRARFIALGCASPSKTWVPGAGSSNGVDAPRFFPTAQRRAAAAATRERLGIPNSAVVVGFVGRFVRDKGLPELVTAFRAAQQLQPQLHLLLIGDDDDTDPLPSELSEAIRRDPAIHVTGFVDEPAAYYPAMDVFAFPSLREGFPNAPLEAAAAELPVVAFRATGTVDAVVDGVTGKLLELGDVDGLSRALLEYGADPALRRRHGLAGRARVEQSFAQERVWAALADEYERLARERSTRS